MIRTFSDAAEMQLFALSNKGSGAKIVLVPTMGYLHEGHASLLREGRKRGDILIASIFVNPAQFGANEDLGRYPKDIERDMAMAEREGVDAVFLPNASLMYPKGYQTYIDVEKLSLPLCGEKRPGHFRGVATVVTKLFMICQPDVALLGKKDFQQLAVIKRMVKDLNIPVEIVGMPIVREPDGLAMSSRNSYLSESERIDALSLSKTISKIRNLFISGEKETVKLTAQAYKEFESLETAKVDYLEFRDGETLEELSEADGSTLFALAVKIGNTRLIDNCILGEE